MHCAVRGTSLSVRGGSVFWLSPKLQWFFWEMGGLSVLAGSLMKTS